MTPYQFTLLFLAVLAASTALRLWLDIRHRRHVVAHRDQVPADFAGRIELEDHRRAADYTVAKLRIGLIGLLVDWQGIGAAEGFLHLFEGWVVFVLCLLLLLAEAALLLKLGGPPLRLRDASADAAPAILTQPVGQAAVVGQSVSLSAPASGAPESL